MAEAAQPVIEVRECKSVCAFDSCAFLTSTREGMCTQPLSVDTWGRLHAGVETHHQTLARPDAPSVKCTLSLHFCDDPCATVTLLITDQGVELRHDYRHHDHPDLEIRLALWLAAWPRNYAAVWGCE